jgi:phospholipid/cholesterol/gamma-HCH transport system substrate-binding protein
MSARPTDSRRLSNLAIGAIAIVLTVVGFYLAFAKSIPFTGHGYEVKAVFKDAQNIRTKSPVRISGVDIGKVTNVEHLTDENGDGLDAAVVTMEIDDSARPLREDTTMALRPRLFLEGNLFVDVHPGSPGSPELDSGDVIPLEQTSISVQFDQVLTSLQKPVRDNLQVFLREFGTALCGERNQQPPGACVPGSGGEGFREYFQTAPAANRYTSEVNEALLGTEPGDLAGFIRNFDTFVRALDRNEEQLKDFVTNFRIVTGSFGSEADALEQAIAELPRVLAVGRPALAKLNADFPALRAFSRELLPGVRATNKALDDANPFVGQLRQLVSKPELRGLVKDLRPTIPSLARLSKETLPFLEETRALSSCFNNVIIPWGNTTVPSTSEPGDKVFKETSYSLTGVAGETSSGDAQGEWFRVLGGGGPNTVSFPTTDVGPTAGVAPFPVQGVEPARQSSAKTPFRPDVACETQEPPNLNAGATTPTPRSTVASDRSSTPANDELMQLSEEYASIYQDLLTANETASSDPARGKALRTQALTELANWHRAHDKDYQQAVTQLTRGAG